MPIGGGFTDVELRLSGLLIREAGKKPEVDKLCLDLVTLGQAIKSFVQRDNFGVTVFTSKHTISQFNAIQAPSMLLGSLLPGAINKNSPHGFGSGGKEVSTVVPLNVVGARD